MDTWNFCLPKYVHQVPFEVLWAMGLCLQLELQGQECLVQLLFHGCQLLGKAQDTLRHLKWQKNANC